MPYIKEDQRRIVDIYIEDLVKKIQVVNESYPISGGLREGTLNYTITRLLNLLYPNDKYSEFNSALGVLDAAAREFYRRRVAPYEDEKIAENGDVY